MLAFYLARPYWGRGLAAEAGQAFLRFGFEQLGLSRIIATVQIGHDASVRVLEKLKLSRVEPTLEEGTTSMKSPSRHGPPRRSASLANPYVG